MLLLSEEPMHGYQGTQAVADRRGGAWRLSPRAVSPTIAQLEDEGLVRVTSEGGRMLVTLTDAGREQVSVQGTADSFTADVGQPDVHTVARDLMGSVHQIGRVGAQHAQAAGVLIDARRTLHLILAGQLERSSPEVPSGPTT